VPELVGNAIRTHGQSSTNAYAAWVQMIQRCKNPKQTSFVYYGARGIKVCERWSTFENFIADMGVRPVDKSLDRIDNDGNYEPGNCRWATKREQYLNSRPKHTSVLLTFQGKTMSPISWAKELGFERGLVRRRILAGWSTERALTTKSQKQSS
jgi:hypothetical protein